MHFVYIAQSLKDLGYYVGCTTDVERRLFEHNSGKTQSLKNRRPLKIVYTEKYNNAEVAYSREKRIKAYKGGEAFQKLIHGGFA
ncbi:MAG: GIY-YIG nuclease family protein [Patescibacteria group bacterium]